MYSRTIAFELQKFSSLEYSIEIMSTLTAVSLVSGGTVRCQDVRKSMVNREYYRQNAERLREKARQYYANNKEAVKAKVYEYKKREYELIKELRKLQRAGGKITDLTSSEA